MDWQEIISIGIVTITVLLLVRNQIKTSRNKKDCSNCALMQTKTRIRFVNRKEL